MRMVRCKFFDNNGRPRNGGCYRGDDCPFIHPDSPALWERTKPQHRTKSYRCRYFTSHGTTIGHGCRYTDSPAECPFSHPEEPTWESAAPPRKPLLDESEPAVSFSSPESYTELPTSSTNNITTGPRALISAAEPPPFRPNNISPEPPPAEAMLVDPIPPSKTSDAKSNNVSNGKENKSIANEPAPNSNVSLEQKRWKKIPPLVPMPNRKASEYNAVNSSLVDLTTKKWRGWVSTLEKVIAKCRELADIDATITIRREAMQFDLRKDRAAVEREMKAYEASCDPKREAILKDIKDLNDSLRNSKFWTHPINIPVEQLQDASGISLNDLGQTLDALQTRYSQLQEQLEQKESKKSTQDDDVEMVDAEEIDSASREEFAARTFALRDYAVRLSDLKSRIERAEEEDLFKLEELRELKEQVDRQVKEQQFLQSAFERSGHVLEHLQQELRPWVLHGLDGSMQNSVASTELSKSYKTADQEIRSLREAVAELGTQKDSAEKKQEQHEENTRALAKDIENIRARLASTTIPQVDYTSLSQDIEKDVQEHLRSSFWKVHGQIEAEYGQVRTRASALIDTMILPRAKQLVHNHHIPSSMPPPRCWNFDQETGEPLPPYYGCPRSNCPFAHPGSPRWEDAPKARKQKRTRKERSPSPHERRTYHSRTQSLERSPLHHPRSSIDTSRDRCSPGSTRRSPAPSLSSQGSQHRMKSRDGRGGRGGRDNRPQERRVPATWDSNPGASMSNGDTWGPAANTTDGGWSTNANVGWSTNDNGGFDNPWAPSTKTNSAQPPSPRNSWTRSRSPHSPPQPQVPPPLPPQSPSQLPPPPPSVEQKVSRPSMPPELVTGVDEAKVPSAPPKAPLAEGSNIAKAAGINEHIMLLADAVALRSEQKELDSLKVYQKYESSAWFKNASSETRESIQKSSQDHSQKMEELKSCLNGVIAKLVGQDVWPVVSTSSNSDVNFLEKLLEVERRLQDLETAAQRFEERLSAPEPEPVQHCDVGISTDPTNVQDLDTQLQSVEELVNDAANTAQETVNDIRDDIRVKLEYLQLGIEHDGEDTEMADAEAGSSTAKTKKGLRELADKLQNSLSVFENELASTIVGHGQLEKQLLEMHKENEVLRELVSKYQETSSELNERIARNGEELEALRALVAQTAKLQEQQTTTVIDERYLQQIRSQVTQQVIASLAPIVANYNEQVTVALQTQREETFEEILKKMSQTSLLISNLYNNVMHKLQPGSIPLSR
ncbi:hypothetical protein M422DRAFT_779416 [Sphaerobolus stellatus SS14]|uniref:C3H1-type domain-containing protein n=1 Tax=Sphaerobolus stellatus (strain SS14) TaxID=990650 RepID=A0A0C9VQ02_SPHS4|nr:hypothetical protein M422DRAFT_779416 [Sphaerobolus stellatus SS14]